ncbi:hypothetical protein C8F04DRAFT_707936 [Mycena alexandri]|uniref:Uncharacterized protein n=1 Tax=Mycena alexandri TaxID=1745969 RepID=A0AAD6X3S3_9AGAR|nr:hypothetical protein C8F04DRAFT_707936 [Mycena alexandri]
MLRSRAFSFIYGTALTPRPFHRRSWARSTLVVLNCFLLAVPPTLLAFVCGLIPESPANTTLALAGSAGLATSLLLCYASAKIGLTSPAAEAWAIVCTGCSVLALWPKAYIQTPNRFLAYCSYQLILTIAGVITVPAWNGLLRVSGMERRTVVIFVWLFGAWIQPVLCRL